MQYAPTELRPFVFIRFLFVLIRVFQQWNNVTMKQFCNLIVYFPATFLIFLAILYKKNPEFTSGLNGIVYPK